MFLGDYIIMYCRYGRGRELCAFKELRQSSTHYCYLFYCQGLRMICARNLPCSDHPVRKS